MKQFNENWDGVSRKNIISEAPQRGAAATKAAAIAAFEAAKATHTAAIIAAHAEYRSVERVAAYKASSKPNHFNAAAYAATNAAASEKRIVAIAAADKALDAAKAKYNAAIKAA